MSAKRKRTKVSILLEDLGWPKSEVQWAVALEHRTIYDRQKAVVEEKSIQNPEALRRAEALLDKLLEIQRQPLLFMQGHLTELELRKKSSDLWYDDVAAAQWMDRFFESPALLLSRLGYYADEAEIHGVVDQMPADYWVTGLAKLRSTRAARWAKLRDLANSGEPENAVAAVRLSRTLGL